MKYTGNIFLLLVFLYSCSENYQPPKSIYKPNSSIVKNRLFCMDTNGNIDTSCIQVSRSYFIDSYFMKNVGELDVEYYIFYEEVNYLLGRKLRSGYLSVNIYSNGKLEERCDVLNFHGDRNSMETTRRIFHTLVENGVVDRKENFGKVNVYLSGSYDSCIALTKG